MSKMVTAAEQEKIMREDEEMMRKYAEAHGCWELRLPKLTDEQLEKWKVMLEREPSHIHIERDSPVRPLPCVRDEHGEIKGQKFFANCFLR